MIRKSIISFFAIVAFCSISNFADAGSPFGMRRLGDRWANSLSQSQPWHGGYYWHRTGQPTALVVPPTATLQTNYSWGVSQNTMRPIYHQYGMGAPVGGGGGVFEATPIWPTHTNQFGVYPVRGPWW